MTGRRSPGRALEAVARAVTALVGAASTAAGAYGIALWAGLDLSAAWSIHLDRRWYYFAPAQSWWPWALLAAGALALVTGAAILVAYLRPRRARRITLGSSPLGRAAVEPSALCSAVSGEFAAIAGVENASATARASGGGTVITVAVRAAADSDPDEIRRGAAGAADHLAATLGSSAPRLRVLLELSKPQRPPTGQPGRVSG
ncbi:hypothetical protein [Tomitella fengzijianii]|uniref:Alkaline shock response membrane anchor protein AmaP n=1 Tax=Tomitella fengzijianii TaxID=2597660 RepID=A0A516X0H7_9ACTN|nr:hypothetical protein [Tomitella fengzijianii]QDQ96589.1 hypothetical protein FO059_03600 [Tomitella fengzijianii]